jgi:hypothetical protein
VSNSQKSVNSNPSTSQQLHKQHSSHRTAVAAAAAAAASVNVTLGNVVPNDINPLAVSVFVYVKMF